MIGKSLFRFGLKGRKLGSNRRRVLLLGNCTMEG